LRISANFEEEYSGALTRQTFLNPINWFRLSSDTFDRAISAEYYDKHVFEGKTFGDMAARKGPFVLMNATDMTHGIEWDSFRIHSM
jgi:NTE family protein